MRVLVTGLGTLGSEIVDQLLERGDEVIGVDSSEWIIAAFRDHKNLTKIMGDYSDVSGKFDLVISTAAYKHVDLIENNKQAAFWNNVMLLEKFYNQVKGKLVFISTDKAVEPSSYYGKTKKIGEKLTFERGGIVVRMGNIMSSSGSVIPKWEKCIEDGLPLPITDPEMTRYMLPVDEMVTKILALLPHAKAGQVVIPEMGEPIKLIDLVKLVLDKHKACERCSNTLDHCNIIGLRPGEKMHEKLKWDNEVIKYKDDNGIIVERSK